MPYVMQSSVIEALPFKSGALSKLLDSVEAMLDRANGLARHSSNESATAATLVDSAIRALDFVTRVSHIHVDRNQPIEHIDRDVQKMLADRLFGAKAKLDPSPVAVNWHWIATNPVRVVEHRGQTTYAEIATGEERTSAHSTYYEGRDVGMVVYYDDSPTEADLDAAWKLIATMQPAST